MANWRGDQGASSTWGGAATIFVGVAAVIAAVLALTGPKERLAAVAIGVSAAVIFVSAVIIVVARKSTQNRRTRRYLKEERTLIVNIHDALEQVKRDLEAFPEGARSLDDHMYTVTRLITSIRATSRIHPLAVRVADDIDKHAFRPQEPEASLQTVIGARLTCDKALDGYDHIERGLESTAAGWLKRNLGRAKPELKKTTASKNRLGAQAGNEVRIQRDEHRAIAAAEGVQNADNPVPGTIKSYRVEGEPQMPGISTLPSAIEYQSTLSRLSYDLSALGDVPAVPQHIAAGAIFEWQLRTLGWLREAERIVTDATALATMRESQTSPSPRLAQATGDAEAGLAWIRDLVAHKGESTDSDRFPERCEETIAAISDIVTCAAGL